MIDRDTARIMVYEFVSDGEMKDYHTHYLREFIGELELVLDSIPDDKKDTAEIEFSGSGEHVEYDIYYQHEETDEEYDTRMATIKILEDAKTRDELALYQRLHEKFKDA